MKQGTTRREVARHQSPRNDGQTQPVEQPWNPSGYLRNLVETVTVEAA